MPAPLRCAKQLAVRADAFEPVVQTLQVREAHAAVHLGCKPCHLATDVVSIGPYVLSGGEIPALALVDAVARRLPGALTDGSGEEESFSAALDGGLEYPHYTRPAEFRGWTVPEILLSGDHARIEEWRREHVRTAT